MVEGRKFLFDQTSPSYDQQQIVGTSNSTLIVHSRNHVALISFEVGELLQACCLNFRLSVSCYLFGCRSLPLGRCAKSCAPVPWPEAMAVACSLHAAKCSWLLCTSAFLVWSEIWSITLGSSSGAVMVPRLRSDAACLSESTRSRWVAGWRGMGIASTGVKL